MNKFIAVAGLLCAGALSSFGATSLISNANMTLGNTGSNTIGGYLASPYDGTLNGAAVKLFCDDFSDTAKASWSADVVVGLQTGAAGPSAAQLAETRFGSATNGSGYPAGIALYEQLAWLFTQATSASRTDDDRDGIQEAAWKLTGATGTTPNVAPGGGTQSISAWITAAQTYYLSTNASYLTPDYSKWMVVTETTAGGYTTGHGGQEFLAYYNTPSGIPVTAAVPEPATFALAGAAFLALGFARRKRTQK